MPERTKQASDSVSEQERTVLRSLFASLPADFGPRFVKVEAIRRAFYEEMGVSLQESMNAAVTKMSSAEMSARDRRSVADWLSFHLSLLGLAVRSEKGRPAMLAVEVDGEQPDARSFFRIQALSAPVTKSRPAAIPPRFELTENPPHAMTAPFLIKPDRESGHGL